MLKRFDCPIIVFIPLPRPGSIPVTDALFEEFTSYMEVIALYKCQINVAGDFNIHVGRDSEAHSVRLNEIIDSFGCIQQVPHVPMQRGGGTLDLIITKTDHSISVLFVDPQSMISDHSLIRWRLPFAHQPPIVEIREVRNWCKVNRDDFRSALGSSKLCDSHFVSGHS